MNHKYPVFICFSSNNFTFPSVSFVSGNWELQWNLIGEKYTSSTNTCIHNVKASGEQRRIPNSGRQMVQGKPQGDMEVILKESNSKTKDDANGHCRSRRRCHHHYYHHSIHPSLLTIHSSVRMRQTNDCDHYKNNIMYDCVCLIPTTRLRITIIAKTPTELPDYGLEIYITV